MHSSCCFEQLDRHQKAAIGRNLALSNGKTNWVWIQKLTYDGTIDAKTHTDQSDISENRS